MELEAKALKLIGRRFTGTNRLVASSKVLHHAIPTKNCDIVMILPAKTDDGTLMWLLGILRSRTPHINVHVRHLKNTGVYGFYMTAAYESLLKGAEELGICKPLRQEYGGGMKEFLFDDQQCYEGVGEEEGFLSSQERQSIVYHMLLNLRATEGETLGKVKFLEGQSIVPMLESAKIVSQVFPLHDGRRLSELRKTWVQTFFQKQPLDLICEYFSVKVALYFAYLGHYTTWLCVPAIVGIVVWFIQGQSQEMEDACFVGFALFNVIWATLYLEHWRRRNCELAYRWGTLDPKDELLQDPRPLYTGYLVTSTVTGRLEPFFPAWKRNFFRYCVTIPVIAICLSAVFYIMLLIFQLQEWMNGLVKNRDVPSLCRFLPKVLLAVTIGIMDEIYKKIAVWLNYMENYRMEESYENHLIVKLILFVNSFLSLFYIAFYIQDMDRLRDQLAALLIVRQVIGNIREALVPYVLWKMRLIRVGYTMTEHMSPHTLEKEIKSMEKEITSMAVGRFSQRAAHASGEPDNSVAGEKTEPDNAETSKSSATPGAQQQTSLVLTQAEVESTMKKYEDTFDDYLEMVIQYGYVILFSSAFPLAALCALLNNVVEIRSDAFKLCMHHQRPFGKRVESIGVWRNALKVIGMIAVVVNTALIVVLGQAQRMKPDLDTSSTIIFIVVLEHIMLVLKICIAYAIPSVPHWIAQEMARWEFHRREALKSLESHSSSPHDLRSPGFPRPSSLHSSPAQSPTIDLRQPPVAPVRKNHSALSSLSLHTDSPVGSNPFSSPVPSSSSLPSSSTANESSSELNISSRTDTDNMFNFPLRKSHKNLEQKIVPAEEQRCDKATGSRHNVVPDLQESDKQLSSVEDSPGNIDNSVGGRSTVGVSKLPGARYVVGYSNPHACLEASRLETRQRILQSAKSRSLDNK